MVHATITSTNTQLHKHQFVNRNPTYSGTPKCYTVKPISDGLGYGFSLCLEHRQALSWLHCFVECLSHDRRCLRLRNYSQELLHTLFVHNFNSPALEAADTKLT